MNPATTTADHTQTPVFVATRRFSDVPHKVLHGRKRSLVTFCPTMFQIIDQLKVAAAHDVTILLVGESGVGKSHLAQLIHELSPRHAEEFVVLDCDATSEDRFEPELFGLRNGNSADNPDALPAGKLDLARRGTCLIEQIEQLPPAGQASLLRVLETGHYAAIGTRQPRPITARLILTAADDMEDLVDAGTIRHDLYFEASALKFLVPPLRSRTADLEYLANDLALRHGRELGVAVRRIEKKFIDALCNYTWPGNVRELDGVIQRAVLYSRDGVLTTACLPEHILADDASNVRQPVEWPSTITLEEKVERVERRVIEQSLRRNGQRRQATARELGISRVTLYNKMKKFGMLASSANAETPGGGTPSQ